MKKLVANRPILFRSTQYREGEQLPCDNQAMVEAWLEADSAQWIDETNDAPEEKSVEQEAEAPEPEEPKAKTSVKKTTVKKGAKKE